MQEGTPVELSKEDLEKMLKTAYRRGYNDRDKGSKYSVWRATKIIGEREHGQLQD